MVVERSRFIDWEPLRIQLFLEPQSPIRPDELQKFISTWLQRRKARPVCATGCTTAFLHVSKVDANSIEILIQWVCDECLEKLLGDVAKAFPRINRAYVGLPEDEVPSAATGVSADVVHVGARVVTLETGESVKVGPFRISAEPVSIGEYERFCQETGYVTVAERTGRRDKYNDNTLLTNPVQDKRFPAMFLSYDDAIEFCRSRSVRLPTDPEMLAALTIDDNIHNLSFE